jgi:hypothetical protein
MTDTSAINRRRFLATQAVGAAALAALPGAAVATGTDTLGAGVPRGATDWARATAAELEPLIGQRFRLQSRSGEALVLRLIGVEPVGSGLDRPADLPRREGAIALFDSPDMAPLVQAGHGLARVSHPALGAADLYLAAVPRRDGGTVIEIVLN